jgi:hypothetical protein
MLWRAHSKTLDNILERISDSIGSNMKTERNVMNNKILDVIRLARNNETARFDELDTEISDNISHDDLIQINEELDAVVGSMVSLYYDYEKDSILSDYFKDSGVERSDLEEWLFYKLIQALNNEMGSNLIIT